jgi:hypothetical protein
MSDSFCQNFRICRVINFLFILKNFAKYDRDIQVETNLLPLEQNVCLRQF